MTASEHTELLPALARCPFDGATAHHGPSSVQHDQHGEPYQRYRVWCPHGCASIERMNKAQAIEAWNRRPDIGPAPVDVPDIKLAIADYLETRDEAMGFISDDDERAQSATDIHDAVQRIHEKVALPDGAEPVPVAWRFRLPTCAPTCWHYEAHCPSTAVDAIPLFASPTGMGVTEVDHVQFRLKWRAGARPPVHPEPMVGSHTFRSIDECARFMAKQAPDAELISLTEIRSKSVDVTAVLTAALHPTSETTK